MSRNIPDTLDAKEIQRTITRAYEIEEIAVRAFDTSKFAEVFINDPRGEKLNDSTLEFIRSKEGLNFSRIS